MGKFLVVHPGKDNVEDVLTKTSAQNAKNGPFDAVLVVGKSIEPGYAPILENIQPATFFQVSRELAETPNSNDDDNSLISTIKPNFNQVTPNPICTVKRGGFNVLFVAEDAKLEEVEKMQNFDCDILISYHWPEAIAEQQKLMLVGNSVVDEVVKRAKPRYHFAVGRDKVNFYESDEFNWADDERKSTRFISLGQYGTGEKWFYAFTIEAIPSKAIKTTSFVNPFEVKSHNDPITKYEWTNDVSNSSKRRLIDDPSSDAKRKATESSLSVKNVKKVSPQNCFFCLSNPKAELHMVVSVGNNCYITIAKGPLPKPSKTLEFSGHGIIIPIEHIPSLRLLESKDITETEQWKDMIQYQDSLVNAFMVGAPSLGLVFFSIDRIENVHAHWQFLPVPLSNLEEFNKALDDTVTLNNEKYVRNQKLHFTKFEELNEELKSILNNNDTITFTVCQGNLRVWYVAKLVAERIDLQFPRRVLAQLLHLKKRVHWEKCKQYMKDEMRDAENFKKFFKDHDFTIE